MANGNALLFTTDDRLRAPWRILLFIVALFIAVALTITLEAFLDSAALAAGYRPLVSEWGFALGAVIATAAMLFWIEHKSWDYVGLDLPAANPGLLARYTLLGVLAIAIPSLLLMAMGQLRAIPAAPGSWWAATGLTFANLLPAAVGEELLLRGYIFAVLREAIGWRWTLIATSIVFGLFHVPESGSGCGICSARHARRIFSGRGAARDEESLRGNRSAFRMELGDGRGAAYACERNSGSRSGLSGRRCRTGLADRRGLGSRRRTSRCSLDVRSSGLHLRAAPAPLGAIGWRSESSSSVQGRWETALRMYSRSPGIL